MDTKSSVTSEIEPRNSILNHIINCANCALQSNDVFKSAMLGLATELRTIFKCEYCSIGIVSDDYAEDIIIAFEQYEDKQLFKRQETVLKSVKRASVDDNNSFVAYALKSNTSISFFFHESVDEFSNYKNYQSILPSNQVINSCVIPIRDINNNNYGFIQLINLNKTINYEHDFLPFRNAFLGLVQIIINNRKYQLELINRANRLKDVDFYSLMLDKMDNIDTLLDSIMEYLSDVFNAAVISFRIPLLNGFSKDPLFYLRRLFVHQSVGERPSQELFYQILRKKNVKRESDMEIAKHFWYDNQVEIFESKSEFDFNEYGLDLDNNTLIMPIYRDWDNDSKCSLLSYERNQMSNNPNGSSNRYKRLYGIFRLRFPKTNNDGHNFDYSETKKRLSYLSRQITSLLNSIVDRHDNESLQIFQNKLKNSSFIKIQDFDKRCVEIIKESIHAKICSIYRYDKRSKYLILSATTAEKFHYKTDDLDFIFNTEQINHSCFFNASIPNNLLSQVFISKKCEYVLNIKDTQIHQSPFIEYIKDHEVSSMAIPMIKKDGSCSGVVLLIGKEAHKHSISTTYWEHDIKSVEFIVSIMTRISESDTERLTFLSQLSHEMLAPVTELVYDNDLTVNIAERNPNSFTRRQLISKLRENISRNMLFKYIISDTEYIYSTSGRPIEYSIVRQEKPQQILLNAVRLLENEALDKGLKIMTYIKQMPTLYFDKERMMQVFINLLKNAIKYSNSRTTISISYNMGNNGFHEICFANFGIGIQENEKESIFELFHRGENAEKQSIRGTGMGLYIVRDIMRAHGGDCYVKKTDCPTEFVITLPNII